MRTRPVSRSAWALGAVGRDVGTAGIAARWTSHGICMASPTSTGSTFSTKTPERHFAAVCGCTHQYASFGFPEASLRPHLPPVRMRMHTRTHARTHSRARTHTLRFRSPSGVRRVTEAPTLEESIVVGVRRHRRDVDGNRVRHIRRDRRRRKVDEEAEEARLQCNALFPPRFSTRPKSSILYLQPKGPIQRLKGI